MTIAEKLTQIAENEQKVYQAGYEVGYDTGYEEGTAIGNEQFAIDLIQGTASGEIRIPNGVTTIRTYLFSDTDIKTIYLPNTVKTLQYYCFANTTLDNIFFEEGTELDVIGTWVFTGCNIDTLKLPYVESIEQASFEGIAANKIVFGKYTGSIGSYALRSNILCEYDFSQSMNIPDVADDTVFDIYTIKSIIVPNHLYNEWINREDWAPYKDYIISSSGKSQPDTAQFTMHVDADTLKTLLDNRAGTNVGTYELRTDEPCKYIRIYGDGRNGESFANASNISNTVTGRYMVYAYRLPTSNTIRPRAFQIYANTNGNTVNGQGDNFYVKAYTDDKWHVDVIDVAVAIGSSTDVRNGKYNSQFTDKNGSFTAKKLRFDWFNEGSAVPTSDYIDIAYIGFCDSIEKARSLDPDYTGAEFDAMYLWNTGAFNLKTTDTGMEYVSRTTNYNALGANEAFVYLTGNTDYVITPNATMYAGVLYRASTDRSYGEMYSCCANNDVANADWYTRLRFGYYYELGDDWHFGVLQFNAGNNIDGATRLLRFDYLNGIENNGKDYTIDIGFVKFFNSVEEGEAYFEQYRQKYDI